MGPLGMPPGDMLGMGFGMGMPGSGSMNFDGPGMHFLFKLKPLEGEPLPPMFFSQVFLILQTTLTITVCPETFAKHLRVVCQALNYPSYGYP